jgi:diguanylate cyclase (GGDEF)-like protein
MVNVTVPNMQLSRLASLAEELAGHGALGTGVVSFELYHHWSNTWFLNGDIEVAEPALIAVLAQTLATNVPVRPKKSTSCFFPVQNLAAVVSVAFAHAPQLPTRLKVSNNVARCLTNAINAFKSSHDSMTGLLNKDAIDHRLRDALAALPLPGNSASDTVQELHSTPCVVVLALDIDHFKQVNDTHGHLYGDVVLQCFARRLESVVGTLARTEHIECQLGRPGGEEFLVVLRGQLSPIQTNEIAERVLREIADTPLPSDSEWGQIGISASSAGIALPHIGGRTVTVSIGTATCPAGLADQSAVAKEAMSLARHADMALYCAKAGGRNTVRHFDDILQRHGHILEHHKETGVVAIDIGSHVNVARGQEFLVFHPEFDGKTPFVFSDGRTRKRLGTYPRRSCGRIVVFDVQTDISFCKVIDTSVNGEFVAGSHLEAVPLGTISHILDADPILSSATGTSLLKVDELVDAVSKIVDAQSIPFVAVFTISDLPDIMRDRGSAAVNNALARLFSSVREIFPNTAHIGQLQTGEICVVNGTVARIPGVETVKQALESAAKGYRGFEFVTGVFCASDPDRVAFSGDSSSYDAKRAIDFARHAASTDGRNKETIAVFDSFVAFRIVRSHMTARRHLQGLADYKAFVEMGVKFSILENQASVGYFDKVPPDYPNALAAIERAIELNPAEPMWFANKAMVTFMLGDYQATWAQFRRAREINAEFLFPDAYQPAMAVAVGTLALQDGNSELLPSAKEIVIGALSLPPEKQQLFIGDGEQLRRVAQDLGLAERQVRP